MSTFDYNLSKAISLIDSPFLAIQKYNISLQTAISDNDIIGQSIVHSNLGQLYRNLGKLKNAKWHLDRAWFLLTQYIKIAATAGGSNWLQLAIRATGLEGDVIESAFITHSSEPNRTKISDGPPIVIFTLQLFTNIGNLCFSRGKYDSAIKCHGICKRLVFNN
jgi:tetratricopeptide (TPR) repeat protein